MKSSFELFSESDKFSTKHKKYFEVYDQVFSKYRNKKITFVEIGVLNGGSLLLWKKFFGDQARIIGIDLNPECKKFEKDGIEIFIGDQSNENFWDDFFKKVGKVDVILDDGGHTNQQQIVTTAKSINNINDGGIIVIEDTHTSYMEEFSNPSKNSYINFSKKIIDDVNYTYPKLGNFKYSFNQFVYSIQYFESFVVYNIDKTKTYTNYKIYNKSINQNNIEDYRNENTLVNSLIYKNSFLKKFKFLKKIDLIFSFYKFIIKIVRYFDNKKSLKKYSKYFK